MTISLTNLIETARRGDADHTTEIFAGLNAFEHIVLRGAGNFGSAFGAFLVKYGISAQKMVYWDIRAETLHKINGIPVELPFSNALPAERTVIINCIPNGSLSGSVGEREFTAAGYRSLLSGMALFEALICDIKPETGFRPEVCIDTTFCNWCACKRLPNMLYRDCAKPARPVNERLVFTVATFVLSQKCSLECTHCGQYINHYLEEERINFPLERILTDINQMFAAVDAIGYVSIIGGEPFLHPDLGRIVDAIMEKQNFGVLGITTNGVCKITDDQLEKMRNRRTRIIFSDYTSALSEKQKKLFQHNVAKVAAAGISHTVGQPIWATPPTLVKQELPRETMTRMKSGCNSTETCKTIQNGIYYPCTTTAALGSHRQADYPTDWVVLDQTHSAAELRARILEVEQRAFYQSCSHCTGGGEVLDIPGRQGIGTQYIHLEQLKRSLPKSHSKNNLTR